MSQDKCYYCGAPATKLCDGIIAYLRKPDHSTGRYVIDTKSENPLFTCDRPMCKRCVERSSNAFYDWTENGRRKGRVESVDYCKQCVAEGYTLGNNHAPLVTQEEGKRLQLERLKDPVYKERFARVVSLDKKQLNLF